MKLYLLNRLNLLSTLKVDHTKNFLLLGDFNMTTEN